MIPDPVTLTPNDPAASADLAEAVWRFRQLTEVVTLHAWTVGPAGLFTFMNGESRRYLGVPAGACPEEGWFEALHPEDRERVQTAWARALTSGDAFEAELRLRKADGGYRWFQARAEALYFRDGRIDRWFGTHTDIENLKLEQ